MVEFVGQLSVQTVWPWYRNIAPISWLVQHDVADGRKKLNFSQWDQSPRGGNASADEVQRGSMPVGTSSEVIA